LIKGFQWRPAARAMKSLKVLLNTGDSRFIRASFAEDACRGAFNREWIRGAPFSGQSFTSSVLAAARMGTLLAHFIESPNQTPFS
jgi:hypothetical protein